MRTKYNSTNPWLDIRTYTTSDAVFFKGRDADVSKFCNIVDDGCMSVIYANSGIGKSSFINAGVIPLLMKEGYYPIHITISDDAYSSGDVVGLVYRLIREDACKDNQKEHVLEWRFLYEGIEEEARNNGIACPFARCEASLWWLLHAYQLTEIETGKTFRPLLVFDQFEEVFTKTKGDDTVLTSIFGLIDSVSPNSYPSEVRDALQELAQQDIYVNIRTGNEYKVIFSLRKEYLSDFDYWTNDRHHISDLLTNRMLLMPMTPKQASEVITKQPKIGQDGYIVEGETTDDLKPYEKTILQKFDRGHYEPFLLSVLCSRLYEAKVSSSEHIPDVEELMADFYDESTKMVFRSKRQVHRFENALVDREGVRKRPLLSDFVKQVFYVREPDEIELKDSGEMVKKRLESELHLVRTMTIGEKVHVELSHDKIADVIKKRQSKRSDNFAVSYARWSLAIGVVVIAVLALYQGQSTDDKNKVMTTLTEVRDRSFSTTDTMWIDSACLQNNGMVEQLAIEGKRNYKIFNCPNLNSIDLSNLGIDSCCLELTNLPQLSTIVMPSSMSCLSLKVKACQRLTIPVNCGMGHLDVDAEKLKVIIDHDVKRYMWKSKILWDIDERRIVCYDVSAYNGQNNVRCFFPEQIKERTIKYKNITFRNLQQEENVDYRAWSSRHLYGQTIDPNDIDPEIRYLYLPDSVYSLPNRMCYQFHRLDSVQMPRYVRIIGESAFEGCDKLSVVHLPEGLSMIEKYAFKDCKELTSIVIPASVQCIDVEAFAGCNKLQSVVIEGTGTRVAARAFAFCSVLNKVDWNPANHHSYPFLDNPFLECPELNVKSLHVILEEQAKVICSAQGVTFYHDGMAYAKEYPAELHMPLDLLPVEWSFVGDISHVTDIYVPVANPDFVSVPYNTRMIFSLCLTDEQKSQITLHVPYGCRRYYEVLPRFEKFLLIDEMSEFQTRWMFVKDRFYRLQKDIFHYWYIHVPLFFVFVLVGLGLVRLKRRKDTWAALLPGALLYAVLIVVAIVPFYWTTMLVDGVLPVGSAVRAVCFSLIIVTIAFMARELREWFRERFGSKPSFQKLLVKRLEKVNWEMKVWMIKGGELLKRNWIFMLLLVVLGVASVVAIGYYRYSHDLEQALRDGNYQRALSLTVDKMLESDSLTADDRDELRRLLICAGVEPEFRQVDAIDNFTTHYSSSDNVSFCAKQNATVFLWNNGELYKWEDTQHRFGSNAHYRIYYDEKMISFYDEVSDSTALYSLSGGTKPMMLEGQVDDVYDRQNIVFTNTKAGRHLVYDLQGHVIQIPHVEYSSTSLSTDAVVRKSTIYTHCGDSLVCHDFGEGSTAGIIGQRYVLWKKQTSGEQHFYDMKQGFALRSDLDQWADNYSTNEYFIRKVNKNTYEVMSSDLKERVSLSVDALCFQQRNSFVFQNKEGLHVFNTRQFRDILISKDVPDLKRLSGYSMSVRDSRFLVIEDNVYLKTYVFDLERDCRLMGCLKGCTFDDFDIEHRLSFHKTRYLWLNTGNDSIQFYHFDNNNRLRRGASLPMAVANEKRWTEGFIIVEDNNRTLLYSMDDEVSKPIVLQRELGAGSYLNGCTMLLPEYEKLHVCRYDDTKELIRRSALSERQKKKVLSFL